MDQRYGRIVASKICLGLGITALSLSILFPWDRYEPLYGDPPEVSGILLAGPNGLFAIGMMIAAVLALLTFRRWALMLGSVVGCIGLLDAFAFVMWGGFAQEGTHTRLAGFYLFMVGALFLLLGSLIGLARPSRTLDAQ